MVTVRFKFESVYFNGLAFRKELRVNLFDLKGVLLFFFFINLLNPSYFILTVLMVQWPVLRTIINNKRANSKRKKGNGTDKKYLVDQGSNLRPTAQA